MNALIIPLRHLNNPESYLKRMKREKKEKKNKPKNLWKKITKLIK